MTVDNTITLLWSFGTPDVWTTGAVVVVVVVEVDG